MEGFFHRQFGHPPFGGSCILVSKPSVSEDYADNAVTW